MCTNSSARAPVKNRVLIITPYAAVTVGASDQPLDFWVVQAFDGTPPDAGRLQEKCASCSLDHVFALVVAEVVFTHSRLVARATSARPAADCAFGI